MEHGSDTNVLWNTVCRHYLPVCPAFEKRNKLDEFINESLNILKTNENIIINKRTDPLLNNNKQINSKDDVEIWKIPFLNGKYKEEYNLNINKTCGRYYKEKEEEIDFLKKLYRQKNTENTIETNDINEIKVGKDNNNASFIRKRRKSNTTMDNITESLKTNSNLDNNVLIKDQILDSFDDLICGYNEKSFQDYYNNLQTEAEKQRSESIENENNRNKKLGNTNEHSVKPIRSLRSKSFGVQNVSSPTLHPIKTSFNVPIQIPIEEHHPAAWGLYSNYNREYTVVHPASIRETHQYLSVLTVNTTNKNNNNEDYYGSMIKEQRMPLLNQVKENCQILFRLLELNSEQKKIDKMENDYKTISEKCNSLYKLVNRSKSRTINEIRGDTMNCSSNKRKKYFNNKDKDALAFIKERYRKSQQSLSSTTEKFIETSIKFAKKLKIGDIVETMTKDGICRKGTVINVFPDENYNWGSSIKRKMKIRSVEIHFFNTNCILDKWINIYEGNLFPPGIFNTIYNNHSLSHSTNSTNVLIKKSFNSYEVSDKETIENIDRNETMQENNNIKVENNINIPESSNPATVETSNTIFEHNMKEKTAIFIAEI